MKFAAASPQSPMGAGGHRQERREDPRGRLDLLAYRLTSEHLLPALEAATGTPGLAGQLRPYAEAFIADVIPAVNVIPKAPKPKRRLA